MYTFWGISLPSAPRAAGVQSRNTHRTVSDTGLAGAGGIRVRIRTTASASAVSQDCVDKGGGELWQTIVYRTARGSVFERVP